jgi:hypothetical protein
VQPDLQLARVQPLGELAERAGKGDVQPFAGG